MSIEGESNGVMLGRLADNPQFAKDIAALEKLSPAADVVLDFSAIEYVNSTHLSALITLRKHLLAHDRHLRLCGISPRVWSVFVATGLDQLFDVSADVPQALASFQTKKNA